LGSYLFAADIFLEDHTATFLVHYFSIDLHYAISFIVSYFCQNIRMMFLGHLLVLFFRAVASFKDDGHRNSHSSIPCLLLSEVRLQRQQVQEGNTDIPFPSNTLQLLLRDPKAFPG